MNIIMWVLYVVVSTFYIIGLMTAPMAMLSTVLCLGLGIWVIWFFFGKRNPDVLKFLYGGSSFSDFVFFSYIIIYLIISLTRFGLN